MNPLPCSAIVYRAMARRGWIDSVQHEILAAAFMRREPPQDELGLSVDIESPASCRTRLRKCYGVVSLHVGRVRYVDLDVIPDEPPHANIVGLPRGSEDRAKAEKLAGELVKQARIVPEEQYRGVA
jgi:hypothetical protein